MKMLNLMFRSALVFSVVVSAAACSSGERHVADPIVDLEFRQDSGLDFESMTPGVEEVAAITDLTPLDQDAEYNRLRPQFECVGLDLGSSWLEIEDLVPGTGSTAGFNFKIWVAQRAAGAGPRATVPENDAAWMLLAEYDGFIRDGDLLPMTDPQWTVLEDARTHLETLAMSQNPHYDMYVAGESTDAITKLLVTVRLELFFSSNPNGCP